MDFAGFLRLWRLELVAGWPQRKARFPSEPEAVPFPKNSFRLELLQGVVALLQARLIAPKKAQLSFVSQSMRGRSGRSDTSTMIMTAIVVPLLGI
jgi:hypothetical protein